MGEASDEGVTLNSGAGLRFGSLEGCVDVRMWRQSHPYVHTFNSI